MISLDARRLLGFRLSTATTVSKLGRKPAIAVSAKLGFKVRPKPNAVMGAKLGRKIEIN